MPYLLNVPSNLIEFKDGGLVFRNDVNATSTKSVLVLGLAQDGPLDPTAVDISTVNAVFGKDVTEFGVPNGGTISTAVNALYRIGCRDIRAMKIAGSQASTEISLPEKQVAVTKKIEENLGLINGNDSTTLILSRDGIIENSIKIYVNDKMLSSSFSFTQATKTITIPANVCEANAHVTVKYNYNETVQAAYEDVLVVNDELIATLSQAPSGSTITAVYSDGILVDSANYTYATAGHTITFLESQNVVTANSIVVVEYPVSKQQVSTAIDNSNNNVPFKTTTSLQSFTLANSPDKATFHLYAREYEVGRTNYVIEGSTVKILKGSIIKDTPLTCSYIVDRAESVTPTVQFESYLSSSTYNLGNITVANHLNNDSQIVGKQIKVNKPESKKAVGEETLTYSSLDYPTLGDLVNVINSDLRNGVYKCSTDFPDELTKNLLNGKFQFAGGDSGLTATKEQIRENLSGVRNDQGLLTKEGIYQLLEGYNVDYILLTGVYADDDVSTKDGFDYELALFCAALSHKNKITYGSIAMSPCSNTSYVGVQAHVNKLSSFNSDGKRFLLKKDNMVYRDNDGKSVDLGQYIRVIAGPEPYFLNDDLGKHFINPAIAYIGKQACMLPQSSPMNKAINSSKGLRYKLSEPQLQTLTSANLICFNNKINRDGTLRTEAFIYDSMTCAAPGSDYIRTTTCEVVRTIGDDVREIADPYIGEPPTVESRNALASQLSKKFSQRKTEGVVQNVSFEIIETPQDMLIGDCKIQLTIVPPGERRRIRTIIGLSPMK